MWPRRHLLRALVAAVGMVALVPGWGGAGEPTDQLRTQIDRVLKTVQDPELQKEGRLAGRRAIRKIADEIFDFDDTARRVLARHWAQRSPAERGEFVALFADVFEHAYVSKIELYQGERLTYLGDTVEGDRAIVRTSLLTRQGSELHVDYRMQRAPAGRWMVYDVVIENVSLIDNYRSQFNSVIQRSSYQELVRKLKAIQLQRDNQEARSPGRS
jgi:phospholipid transport system substrate-binding protein